MSTRPELKVTPVAARAPWAEFLAASFDQYGCFPRRGDVPPSYFEKIDRDSLRAIWRKSLALTRGSCPREIGLEIHGSSQSNAGTAGSEFIQCEADYFSDIFENSRFSILSLEGKALSILKEEETDCLLSHIKERFALEAGAFISVSSSVESLTDLKWRVLLRHQITSLSLEWDGKRQDWARIFRQASSVPGLLIDIKINVSNDVATADFMRNLMEVLKLRPSRIYFRFPDHCRSDRNILVETAGRLILNAGNERQDFGAEYFFLCPWEEDQIKFKRKLRDSILSLGLGGMSHAFGSAYYYQSGDFNGPEFLAIDWSLDEEMRAYALGALGKTRRISLSAFADLFRKSLWDVEFLAEAIRDLEHLGFLKIEGDCVVWNGDDEVVREIRLKMFLNPHIVKSLFKSEALAFREFSNRFDRSQVDWKVLVRQRMRNQETAAYYDPKFWNH